MVDQTQVCCPACTSPLVSPIAKEPDRYQHHQRLCCQVCGHRFTVWGKTLGLMAEVLVDHLPVLGDTNNMTVDSGLTNPIALEPIAAFDNALESNPLESTALDKSLADQPEITSLEPADTPVDPYAEAIQSSFVVLQSLLTQYPTVRQMVQAQPQLPAQNIVALFAALDNLITHWQLEPIGAVWAKVAYDPQLHQADQSDLKSGEEVYVRFMGYRRGEMILVPARVSRQLPSASVAG